MTERRCAVLLPVADRIEPECERALLELAGRGCEIRRMTGHSAIDLARSLMASAALADGFDELLWVDADIGFPPDALDRIRAHDRPFVCAIYPKKGLRELACHVRPDVKELVFGDGGGLVPMLYAGAGFLYTRREVYDAIREKLALPPCNARFGRVFHPYFQPLVVPDGDGHWYLGEDYAFCERARSAGFELVADTTIRLFHVGRFGYSWEDAGRAPERFGSYRLVLGDHADLERQR